MNEPTLVDLFLGLVPLLVVIGMVWFFIQLLSGYQKRAAELLRRQSEALERIAAALEKRP